MHSKDNSNSYIILVTGLLVGFPALVTDMYLPGFPSLMQFFNTNISIIQMSLMSTMLGIASGQLIIGPLSDKHGRIAPLLISLTFFIISTVFCVYTSNIYMFLFLRLAMGFTCSSGMVLSRAILTDKFTGSELAKSLSVNTAVLGFSPAIAPVLGGIILTFSNWQGIFIFTFLFGAALLVLCFWLRESNPKIKRTPASSSALSSFGKVAANKVYIYYVLIFSFAMAVMFAYVSSSPFIFQGHYGLSPLVYSIIFGANALALAVGAFIAGRLNSQFKAIRTGITGLVSMALVVTLLLLFNFPVFYFETGIFIMFIFNGIIYPSSTTLALECNRDYAGTASSIHGAMSFLVGGIISPLVGLGNILYSTAAGILGCSLATVVLFWRLKNNIEKQA
mgnify:CR=1 FL=1